MENTENLQQKAKCFRCKYYIKYFIRGDCAFKSISMGECRLHKKIVGAQESCEKYTLRQYRAGMEVNFNKKLSGILDELNGIRLILQDIEDEKQ